MYITPRLALRVVIGGMLFGAIAVPLSAQPLSAQTCVGDADGNSTVTVAELVQAVRNVLDGCPPAPAACNGDADGDGEVMVSELVQAVNNLLLGCPDTADLVVDVDWLVARLDDPSVQIVDARVASFDGGHIPGALPLSPYTLAMTREGVDFQVIESEAGAAALAAIGLRPDATVVVYGAPPEFDSARVVWALLYLGHDDVRYLDGGLPAWIAQDAPILPGPPVPAPETEYEVDTVRDEIRVTGAWVLDQLGDPPYDESAIQLIDARSAPEFAAGHIPTAIHIPWPLNLEAGLLRSPTALTAFYAGMGLDPSKTTVVYCLAGWRASLTWIALKWLGFDDVRVYDGSWIEWGAGGFPIEVVSDATAGGN